MVLSALQYACSSQVPNIFVRLQIFCQFTNLEYVVYVFYMLQYVQADDGQFPSSKYRHQRVISGGKHFTGDTQTSQIHIWPIFHNYGYLGCNLALAILELFIPPPIPTWIYLNNFTFSSPSSCQFVRLVWGAAAQKRCIKIFYLIYLPCAV